MNSPGLQTLAHHVRQGDRAAVPEFREKLLPQFQLMIRRALRPSTPRFGPVDRIRRTVQEVADEAGIPVDGNNAWLVARAARVLCDQVVWNDLLPGSGSQAGIATVCV